MKILALAAVVALMGGGATPRPALRLLDLTPLTLRGTNFKPGERVKVLLAATSAQRAKVVRAGELGRFRVRFDVSPGRCDSVVVQAIGSRGSRATFSRDVVHCTEP